MTPDLFSGREEQPVTQWAGHLLLAEAQLLTAVNHLILTSADPLTDPIYEMRKSIRRTLTALRIFKPYFEARWWPPYRQTLRGVMARLGMARDTAVFAQNLTLYQEDAHPASPPWQMWRTHWAAEVVQREESVRDYLSSAWLVASWPDYEGALTRWLVDSPAPNAPPLHDVLPLIMGQQLEPAWRYQDSLGEESLAEWHALRLQLKFLRYTLEFFQTTLPGSYEESVAPVKALQDGLGEINDARLALDFIEQSSHFVPLALMQEYRQFKLAEIATKQAAFLPQWASFCHETSWHRQLLP